MLVALIASSAGAQAPAEALKLSVSVGQALPLGRAAARWAERLVADGIPVNVHPGAALAQRDPSREFIALRDGAADLALGSALAWATQVPGLGVYGLPWIAGDPAELRALVAHPNVQRAIIAQADARGVIVLAFAPIGYRDIAVRNGPRGAPDDLRDLRLRVAAYPMLLDLYAALGVRYQSLGFAQAQGALSGGQLDGEEGLASTLANARLGALGLKYLLHWGGVADVALYAVRRPVWDRWTQQQRDKALADAQQIAREVDLVNEEENALVELRRQGMTVQRLSAAQHDAFRAAAAPVVEKWRAAIGDALVKEALDVVAASRASK
ncbi:MAG TPA: TRAP transporter substrate-binding protein DctP [Casimicrobiaceae bacterium]|nr:TRAP transporter substrate-binding protein DctP [Casimicrobiaceae bacterium]